MFKLFSSILFKFFFFIIFLFLNWVYQVYKKPAELVHLFYSNQPKTLSSTWSEYNEYFEEHSTKVMTKEFLGALVQVESSGRFLATPKWRWRWTTDITRIYSPASSAVGLLQYLDATFESAKRTFFFPKKKVKEYV